MGDIVMTEEEKKSAYEAAKARIANKAVTFATVMSTLTPTLSNAQSPEQSADFSPTPVEQTISQPPSSTMVTSLKDASNSPTFGDDAWLKAQMQADRAEYDASVSEQTATSPISSLDITYAQAMELDLPEYLEQRNDLETTLASPVKDDDYIGHIGNWSTTIAENYTSLPSYQDDGTPAPEIEDVKTINDLFKYKRNIIPARDIPTNQHEFLSFKNHNYEIANAPEKIGEDNALAFFSPSQKKIIIHNYSDKEKAANSTISDSQSEFIKGNPIVRIATLYHENTHSKHILYDGAGENKKTPINAAKNDRLTETTAKAVEYLAVAKQYSIMKEQGIQTISTPQTETMLDILERYNSTADPKPLNEYLAEQNVFKLSNSEQQGDVNDFASFMPNVEKSLEAYNLIHNATINYSGEEEIFSSATYIANSSRPFSEVLKSYGATSVTINNEIIPIDELETKYPDIKELTQEYDNLSKTYASFLQEKPLESILTHFPGLKEAMPDGNFDPNNQEQVRNIVQASSDYWHSECKDGYASQSTDAADTNSFPYYTWSEQLEILQQQDASYNETSERMLKNLYIGQNTTVDLTNCRDLLDTMSNDDALKLIQQHNQTALNDDYIPVISYEEMKQIDTHLESLGLKTDEEKMEYMSNFINSAATRTNTHTDPVLSEILLSHNSHIGYVDGTSIDTQNGIIGQDAEGNKYDLTHLTTDKQALPAEMKQDRQTHDMELQSQTETLSSHSTPQQAGNENISPISPAMLIQGQRQGR